MPSELAMRGVVELSAVDEIVGVMLPTGITGEVYGKCQDGVLPRWWRGCQGMEAWAGRCYVYAPFK